MITLQEKQQSSFHHFNSLIQENFSIFLFSTKQKYTSSNYSCFNQKEIYL